MAGIRFSDDVLAVNPDLVHKLKTSKAKTPSGKGHGHTDDAQDYQQCTISHADLCRNNARTCYNILSGHVGKLNDEAMERRLAAALAALGELGGEV